MSRGLPDLATVSVSVFCILLSWAISQLLIRKSGPLGLLKTNYEGETLVSSLGAALWLAGSVGCGLAALIPCEDQSGRIWAAFALVGFGAGLLGLLDDRFGSRRVGGFRGHFGELAKGRLTTGAAKALILPPVALAGGLLLGQPLWRAVITLLLVALCANTINLLDVRPARAITAWLTAGGLAAIGAAATARPSGGVLMLVGPVLVYLPLDAGRVGMLGDVGANYLGAILGFQIAVGAPVALQGPIIGTLVALQLYSERHSLSVCIERYWCLRWLDAPGKRNPPGNRDGSGQS